MAIQASGDLDVSHPLGRVEDHPRPLHVTPRRRDFPRTTLELVALLSAQLDHVAAPPGAHPPLAPPRKPPSHNPGRLPDGSTSTASSWRDRALIMEPRGTEPNRTRHRGL